MPFPINWIILDIPMKPCKVNDLVKKSDSKDINILNMEKPLVNIISQVFLFLSQN